MAKIIKYRGILIAVYPREHGVPHVHALYGGDVVVFQIDGGAVLGGHLPDHSQKLAQDWVKKNQSRCQKVWNKMHTASRR